MRKYIIEYIYTLKKVESTYRQQSKGYGEVDLQ